MSMLSALFPGAADAEYQLVEREGRKSVFIAPSAGCLAFGG